jgi:hypothetical protein
MLRLFGLPVDLFMPTSSGPSWQVRSGSALLASLSSFDSLRPLFDPAIPEASMVLPFLSWRSSLADSASRPSATIERGKLKR